MASIFERLSLYPKIKKQELFSYGKYKKRCNYPNSLMDKEKAIISDGLSSVAPSSELELRNDKNLTQRFKFGILD
jgi:hypothetical protein